MASETPNKNMKSPAKFFGLGRTPNRPSDPLVNTQDTTAWEIYNYKASEVDREMTKDWNESLNTLLIFVSQALLIGRRTVV
jgi:hypothetical protein